MLLKLIDETIAVWEFKKSTILTSILSGIPLAEIKFGTNACPLCSHFFNHKDPSRAKCSACPIGIFTKAGCSNTPYILAQHWYKCTGRNLYKGYYYIDREIEFLKKVRKHYLKNRFKIFLKNIKWLIE